MTAESVIEAFGFPDSCRVNQRIPKKLLVENGGVTAADKRRLSDRVGEITWAAVLKPDTVGIPAYRDEHREYIEISVIGASLRPGGSPARLIELIHRAIPYPLILIAAHDSDLSLSLAHKRWSQGESGKTVLDGELAWVALTGTPFAPELLSALALAGQSRAHLLALYQSWIDLLTALQAARFTGSFSKEPTSAQAETRRAALRECVRLETEIVRLRAAASKEKQLPRQVDLNLELKSVQSELNHQMALLY